MPITLPAFKQYQQQIIPLRGVWHRPPPEGDYFVSAEIDWLVSPPGNAVQFSLSGNSPVALSQIAALYVDNGRSGSDVAFIFPDTGFELIVAARNQGLFPVLTNALTFYAVALAAVATDVTVLQILNSVPPPIPITASVAQNSSATVGVAPVNGSTPAIPAGVNGTLNSASITIDVASAASAAQLILSLVDGGGATLWSTQVSLPASTFQVFSFNPTGLNKRFTNGVNIVVSAVSGFISTSGVITSNLYYSVP